VASVGHCPDSGIDRLLPAKDCPELAAGFAAILTDFINTTLGGCAPDPKFYEPKIEGGGQAAA